MGPAVNRLVHFLPPTGAIACHGITLVKPGKTLHDDNPVVTIYPADVTCDACKAALVILQRKAVG